VFVLQCHSTLPFCLFCLVSSSSSVICNCTVVQSSTVHTVIQITFIHSYINTFAHQCIHNIYMISIPTWLHQSLESCFGHISSIQSLLIIVSKLQVPTNEQLVIIIKSVIPSVSGQEMSLINHFKWPVRTIGQLASYLLSFIICQVASPNNRTTGIPLFISQSFQVASPNNRTTCILPFIFYHMPSGKSEQPDNWHPPFYQSIIPSGQSEQPDSLHLPFYFHLVSSRQS